MAVNPMEVTQKRFRRHVQALRKDYSRVCNAAAAMRHEGWSQADLQKEADANFMAMRTLATYAFVGEHIEPTLWDEFPRLYYTYFRIAASAPQWFDPDRIEAQPKFWLTYANTTECSTNDLLTALRLKRDGLPNPGTVPVTKAEREAVRIKATRQAEGALRRLNRLAAHLNTVHAPLLGLQVTIQSTSYLPTPSAHATAEPPLEV